MGSGHLLTLGSDPSIKTTRAHQTIRHEVKVKIKLLLVRISDGNGAMINIKRRWCSPAPSAERGGERGGRDRVHAGDVELDKVRTALLQTLEAVGG